MKTFKLGGVHPAENKLSESQPIEVLQLPKKVFIPLAQNLGAPSVAVVKRGDEVKVGQLLGKAEAFICSNVHSSVSGKVTKIDNFITQTGYKTPSIHIDVAGDEWDESIDTSTEIKHEIKLSKEEIVQKIKEMGIVGMGGAAFPTHVKLMPPPGKKAEFLLINGVECEPYLTSDHRIMLEKSEELMIGVSILMKGMDVKKALIGIENNKPDAIEKLSKLAIKYDGISVHPLKIKYPQGGEKQLIKALVNREVPSGKLPIEVGCVVNNVGTAFAVYEAVQKNKPLIERVVSVTGKTLAKPSNLMVRIGTQISELIDKTGGIPEGTGKVVGGGPMMGKALVSIEAPIVKGSSGILIFDEKEEKRLEPQNCIRCARCITACPMGLEPVLLAQYSEIEMFDLAEENSIMDCMECGSCHYTCPANRPLLDYIRVGKNKVGLIIRNRGKA